MLFLSITYAPHHSEANLFGSAPLIVEFYPRALLDDEYFAIGNPSSSPISLLGWSVTDGEGTIVFRSDLWIPPLKCIYASFNSTSFGNAYGRPPEVRLDLSDASSPVTRTGTFRLADSGDSLELRNPSLTRVDVVIYGSADAVDGWSGPPIPSLRQGEIARRVSSGSGWVDTNTAADWMPFREYKYGFTDYGPVQATVAAGSLTAFVSPDCSLEVALDDIRGARHSISLCTYQLSSSSACSELLNARARGVDVRVLVDGQPAGGIDEREIACLSALVDGGVSVVEIEGNLSIKIVQHFGPMHAKYAVIDNSKALVLSENFVESGLPVDKIVGNRGWGISVDNAVLARALTTVFDDDTRPSRADVESWAHDPRYVRNARLPSEPDANHSVGSLRPFITNSSSTVRLIVSPDGSVFEPFLVDILSGARSLLVQQFEVVAKWEGRWDQQQRPSPLLESILWSLRAGSSVRMLFDSSWFNSEGNKPALDYMVSAARNESLKGEFKFMDPRNPITVSHNKGVVVDGFRSIVSSNNWGISSFSRNREVAAIVDSSEVAGYFQRAFEMDWSADVTPPSADAGPDIDAELGEALDLNSTRSSDDRVIAHSSWDLDEDGFFESEGDSATFYCTEPGTHRVQLRVEDAWGNADTDEVFIRVGFDPASQGGVIGSQYARAVLAALGAAIGGIVGVVLARHKETSRARLIKRKRTLREQ